MKADLLCTTIIDYFAIGKRSLCIEGAPGGGKTSIVKQAARRLKVPYIGVHIPTSLVEDFGVPDIVAKAIQDYNAQVIEDEDNSFGYRLPGWFPTQGGPLDNGRGGILCFDDRNQGDHSIQKVLANIIQEGTLHGHRLAKGWYVISTGNRKSDRSGANRVLGHLSDRETSINLDTDLDTSTKWMVDNDVAPEVVSYLRFIPAALHDWDSQRDKNSTPRGWVEGVSDVLGRIQPEAELECFAGAVGEGRAAEFVGFLRIYRDLPDPDEIIRNPDKAVVPTDSATRYAIAGALASRSTPENFANVVRYANRLPADFSILLISMAVRGNDDLSSTDAFIDWASSAETHAVMW